MLPALRLSDPPDLDHHLAFKKREATWKRLVSDEHKKWCLCGSYLNHFLPATEPLKQNSCSGGGDSEGDAIIPDAGGEGGSEDAAGGEDVVAAGGEDGYLTEDLFINGFLDDIDIYMLLDGNL